MISLLFYSRAKTDLFLVGLETFFVKKFNFELLTATSPKKIACGTVRGTASLSEAKKTQPRVPARAIPSAPA
jgi:hypothetical protein